MKRILAALALGAAALASPAFAGTVENAFGNTMVAQVAGGPEVRIHFNADSSYVMNLPDGTTVPGAWALQNGQLCMTPQGGAAQCYPDPGDHKVGDSWTATGPDGDMTLSLVAGR